MSDKMLHAEMFRVTHLLSKAINRSHSHLLMEESKQPVLYVNACFVSAYKFHINAAEHKAQYLFELWHFRASLNCVK